MGILHVIEAPVVLHLVKGDREVGTREDLPQVPVEALRDLYGDELDTVLVCAAIDAGAGTALTATSKKSAKFTFTANASH